VILVATVFSLYFFFFSAGYTGVHGKLKRVSRMFLMLAFGASFGNMVMGVVTRLIDRFIFLLGK